MSDPSTARDEPTCDIAIVGGGIIGLSTALALADRGRRVCVFERGPGPATGASGAAAGIISLLFPWECPEQLQALAAESIERYADWCTALETRSGKVTGWHRCGMLSFDCEDEAAAREWAAGRGVRFEVRSAQEFPQLAAPRPDGWWFADAGAVEPPRLLEALRGAAEAAGVDISWGRVVSGFVERDGEVRGVRFADGRQVLASATVVAGGAWTAGLLAEVGIDVPLRPVRGQVIELSGPPDALDCIVVHRHRYLVPRPDGRLVVGSTAEDVGFDAGITERAAAELRAFATGLLPASADWPVARHWAGLRPGVPDGLPLMGPVDGRPGLWLNTGHFRNGITLAPAAAERLAVMITD